MGRFDGSGNGGRRDSNRSDHSRSSRFSRRDPESDGGESGGFSRRGPSRFGGKSSGARSFEMHEVTCDKCGQKCEVPFRPTKGKPVYCSDCFRKGGDREPRSRPQYSERSNSGESDKNTASEKLDKFQYELDQINEKLNKILNSLGLD